MPTLLSIADETDLIVTIPRGSLVDALYIAVNQLDVTTDAEAAEYGYDTVAQAHAYRDDMLKALNALNGAV